MEAFSLPDSNSVVITSTAQLRQLAKGKKIRVNVSIEGNYTGVFATITFPEMEMIMRDHVMLEITADTGYYNILFVDFKRRPNEPK
jgi:hypothetical protein